MKKVLFLLLIIVVTVSLLALGIGCKTSAATSTTTVAETTAAETTAAETTAGAEKEPVKLTMWWWGEQEGPGLEGWINESIEKYQTLNPNITIEAVLQTTEGLYSAFRTAAEAKKTPDIQYLWSEIGVFEDVWKGNIMDITKFWSEEDLKNMNYADTGLFEGKRYGVSFYFMPYTMVYNKKVLESSGIMNPPTTWSEFLDDCKILKDKGYIPFSTGLKDNMFAAFIVDSMLPQYINKQSDVMLPVIGKAKWTDDNYVDWLKQLNLLTPYLNEDAASIDVLQGVDAFGLGNVGFTYYAYGGISPLYKILGNDLQRMSFPKIGDGSIFSDTAPQSAQQLVVPAYSKHPKEATDFLKFLLSQERANAMYAASGLFPVNKEFDTNLLRNDFESAVYKYSVERPMHNSINYMPFEVSWGGIATYHTSMYNQEITPEDVAQKIEDINVQWRQSNPDMLKNYERLYKSLVDSGN